MVTEMQRHVIQPFKEHAARSSEAPQELKELDVRLERLRKRLKEGDPDIAADELQAAIERAEAKRRQLKNGLQDNSEVTKIISAIPRASALCDQRITLGLSGDAKASEEARVVLRQLIPDRIRLSPKEDGSLWARSALQPAALLVATGYRGRGDPICRVPVFCSMLCSSRGLKLEVRPGFPGITGLWQLGYRKSARTAIWAHEITRSGGWDGYDSSQGDLLGRETYLELTGAF